MKRMILSLVIMVMTMFSAHAQIATENSTLFDNTYISVEAGVASPLDMNSIFPINEVIGLKYGKEITPVLGVELEGQVFFNDNHEGEWTNGMIKGHILGANGTLNLNNLFNGYKGKPQVFETKINAGLGWLHRWNKGGNGFTGKTALDFVFNLGKKRASSIFVSPGVYWNLGADKGFNKHLAQIGIFVGYTYHFKTSNGTHHFKTYDVGAMQDEIDRLNQELKCKIKPVPVVIENEVKVPVVVENEVILSSDLFVFFAVNSAELTEEAKNTLDKVEGNVDVIGSASPEGTVEHNIKLSEQRANAVAEYLTNRGITVNKIIGNGSVDETSGRVAVIKVNK